MKKTTKKDFDLFVSECRKWIKEWRLDDWRIDFYLEDVGDAMATCTKDIEGKITVIKLNTEIGKDDITDETATIKEAAKHEMIHILVGKLGEKAKSRHYTSTDCYEAEEELVRKLENIL